MSKPDTSNDFMVGVQGKDVIILGFGKKITGKQALRLAAWIVSMVDYEQPEGERFADVLAAVQST